MPKKSSAQTPEQIRDAGRRDMQDALREAIGDLTVTLAENGHAGVLDAEAFQPTVRAWKAALTPPQPSGEEQPSAK